MRKETVEAKTEKEAKKLMPWAQIIHKVEDGYSYMGWESIDAYIVWRRQNSLCLGQRRSVSRKHPHSRGEDVWDMTRRK